MLFVWSLGLFFIACMVVHKVIKNYLIAGIISFLIGIVGLFIAFATIDPNVTAVIFFIHIPLWLIIVLVIS